MNWNTNGYSNIQKAPLYITRSGYFLGGSFFNQASRGYLWSGTTYSGTNAYHLVYGSSGVGPADLNNRQYGFPVRCITRDFNFLLVQYGIVVNYVGRAIDATWTTSGFTNIQTSPLYTTRSGLFLDSIFNSQMSIGYLWSGTTYADTLAYYLGYSSSNVYPADNIYRQYGVPVRCINRDFNFLLVQYGIAVNYVGASSDATWVTSGYDNMQNNPLYIPRSGYFARGSFYGQASDGFLRSGTTYSGTGAYYLYYNSSYVGPADNGTRQDGFPVRCIA